MKYKIKTINYDGTTIEVEVSVSVYNYDKENFWQEDWRNRKSKQADSYGKFLKIMKRMDSQKNYSKFQVKLNT